MATERWRIYRPTAVHPMQDISATEYKISPGSWQWAALMLAMGKKVRSRKDAVYPIAGSVYSVGLHKRFEPYRLVESGPETFGFDKAREYVKQGKRVVRKDGNKTIRLRITSNGNYNFDEEYPTTKQRGRLVEDSDLDATDWRLEDEQDADL